MANGSDRLLEQLRGEAAREAQPSAFQSAFLNQFNRSIGQQNQLQAAQQLENTRLQNDLLLESFRQSLRGQQNQQLFEALNQSNQLIDQPVRPATPTPSDKDTSEIGLLESRIQGLQAKIRQFTPFAQNPAVRVQIDSLRDEMQTAQKRIIRVRDRIRTDETDVKERIQSRLDKLSEIEGGVPVLPEELDGLSPQEKIDFINERIRLSKRADISGTDAIKLQGAKAFVRKAEEIIPILRDSGFLQEALSGFRLGRPFSQQAQQLNKLIFDLSDRLLRARTGAQANRDEIRRFASQIVDLSSSDEVNIAAIQSFVEEMRGVIRNLETGKAEPDINLETVNPTDLSTLTDEQLRQLAG